MSSQAKANTKATFLPARLERHSLQADVAPGITVNPAMIYLARLQSDASKRTMTSVLNSAAKWFARDDTATWRTCEWARLSRVAIIGYAEYLRKDKRLSSRSIRNSVAALRGVAREAWLADLMPENAYRKIKEDLPHVSGYQIAKGRALSKDELLAMLKTCDQRHNIRGLRDAAIVCILSMCGLRRAELVHLDYEHIDWNNCTLTFIGKGNKERIAFLPAAAQSRLWDWCDRVRGTHHGALFFGISRGEAITEDRLTADGLHYIVTKLSAEAKISPCSAHDLRRTYATLQFESDVDILTIRDNMGHASVTTTQIYDHRNLATRRKSTEIFEF
ncbi:tyrosine-type recombinase/integrase [Pseudovibrio sp. Ad37]|uniref:tyrosine-type recombinase/integrase n=1 Tax=Pseudovibrio sp. Ad37 TaxID=989422 RepID=UPI0007AE812B|nr:tyrosine-type recombinase/integrase [Pseudovibrio sp. Ad37]KZL15867.1 Tyrosine recombinase XerD [Pseudovibrio sp. Ad37]